MIINSIGYFIDLVIFKRFIILLAFIEYREKSSWYPDKQKSLLLATRIFCLWSTGTKFPILIPDKQRPAAIARHK